MSTATAASKAAASGLPMRIDPTAHQPPEKDRSCRAPASRPGMEQASAKESCHQLGPERRATAGRRREGIGVGFYVRLSLHRNCPAARCLMCPVPAMKSRKLHSPICPDRSGGSARCRREIRHLCSSRASCRWGTADSKSLASHRSLDDFRDQIVVVGFGNLAAVELARQRLEPFGNIVHKDFAVDFRSMSRECVLRAGGRFLRTLLPAAGRALGQPVPSFSFC